MGHQKDIVVHRTSVATSERRRRYALNHTHRIMSLVHCFEHLGFFTAEARLESGVGIPILSVEDLEQRLRDVGVSDEVIELARNAYRWNFRELLPDLLTSDVYKIYGQRLSLGAETARQRSAAILDQLESCVVKFFDVYPCLRPQGWVRPGSYRRARRLYQQVHHRPTPTLEGVLSVPAVAVATHGKP